MVVEPLEVGVIGMGYVGITTAALLANVDEFTVTGIQRRSKRSGWKIDHLNSGKSPIEGDETELAGLIERVVKNGSFRVTDDTSVIAKADVILIAVQTPVNEYQKPRYSSLKEVSESIGRHMKRGAMVCLESTVAPGTTEYYVKPILEEVSGLTAGVDFNLVFSYERVTVGRLIYNLRNMPKVIGGLTPECTKRGIEFYKHIVDAELLPTDCMTAEVAKVTENTYRDVNIAFANEVALICESLGVNVHDVRRFVNSLPHDPSDPAKNPYRLMHIPGAGVGGHCLPKDPWLLKYGVDAYGRFKVTPKVIISSREINDYMPAHMKRLILEAVEESGVRKGDAKIAILGLAFVEDSDDVRNTPAIPLYEMLRNECGQVIIHDPYVKEYEGIPLIDSLDAAIQGSDCLAIVTGHRQYRELDLERLKDLMSKPVIVDGRNIFDPGDCVRAGFIFRGVGIGFPEARVSRMKE